jgi:serine/threonine protein phosphatase PrpC
MGLKRSENQDNVLARVIRQGERPAACLAVADGMGGHEKGGEASLTAIETVSNQLELWIQNGNLDPTEEWCVTLENEAHRKVNAISQGEKVTGTTLTLAVVAGEECFIGHVGDSRAYSYRNGKLDQITEDQTWEAHARKSGIPNEYGKALRQAIGVTESITPDVYRVEFLPEDLLLLCSDGLYNALDDAAIGSALHGVADAADACDRLLNLAFENGARDDFTVCVARFGDPVKSRRGIVWDLPLIGSVAIAIFFAVLIALTLIGRM